MVFIESKNNNVNYLRAKGALAIITDTKNLRFILMYNPDICNYIVEEIYRTMKKEEPKIDLVHFVRLFEFFI